MLKILVMAALPNEYAHFRQITRPWRVLSRKPYKTFTFVLPGKEIILIETGMGRDFASHALQNTLAFLKPDLLILVGFAGALHPKLRIGDVCAVTYAKGYGTEGKPEIDSFQFVFPDELSIFLAERAIIDVTAVTVTVPPDKIKLSALLTGQIAIVDMETSDIAALALGRRIPFLCLRSISDRLEDELGFDLEDITGEAGKIDIMKVIRKITSTPAVIASFYKSWKCSRLAGERLGLTLVDLLSLPDDTLRGITTGISVEACRRG